MSETCPLRVFSLSRFRQPVCVCLMSLFLLATPARAEPQTVVATVLGKRVEVTAEPDKIGYELQQKILPQLVEKYKAAYEDECTPTPEEHQRYADWWKKQITSTQQAQSDAPIKNADPQLMSQILLPNYKFYTSLYRRYGGGRLLWQQFGVEPYDAMRHWLESEEKAESFEIPEEYHEDFYAYWNQKQTIGLSEDLKQAEDYFLNPPWSDTKLKMLSKPLPR
ncbi:MAG: hypothetical protein KDA78_17005 [Planctomycetaceae bacterium]|nr:hypothetical protein [Planctomycetaceae bacterium]